MSRDANGKRRQSPTRNDDTKFINDLWRANEQAREARSRAIRDRERRARERLRKQLESFLADA